MTGKADVWRNAGVRDGNSAQLPIEDGRGGRQTVRANLRNRFTGNSWTLAKRQESNGYREISRLTMRNKL